MYDPNLEVVGEPRILFWLTLNSWTLLEAAMLFCDIDPEYASLGDHDRLIRCSTMEGYTFDDKTPRVDLRDPDVDPRDVGPWNIDSLADTFLFMRRRLQPAADADEKMSPASWINYAEEENIPVPWLEWARRELPEFPWKKAAKSPKGVGIDRNGVMSTFRVRPKDADNKKFWSRILGDVPKWLQGALITKGRPGLSSRWDVLNVGHALLSRPHNLMTLQQLDVAIRKHHPELYEQWEEETPEKR